MKQNTQLSNYFLFTVSEPQNSREKGQSLQNQEVPGDELQWAAVSVAVSEAFLQSFFSLLTFPPYFLDILLQLPPLSVPLLQVITQRVRLLQGSIQTPTQVLWFVRGCALFVVCR